MKKDLTKPLTVVYALSSVSMVFVGFICVFTLANPGSLGNVMTVPLMLGGLFIGQIGWNAARAIKSSETRIEKLESELRDLKSKLESQESSK